MEKESGVYLTITDNSFQTGIGAGTLKVVVPMLTTKGKLGLNLVNANNFKDVIGYDLDYNPNYYSLENKILNSLSYAYVWRLNNNAKLANAYFADASSDKASDADASSFDDITQLDPKPLLAVALKDVGNPETIAVKVQPLAEENTVLNENPIASNPQAIVFADVSSTEELSYDGKTIKSGCIFYNSANNSVVGIIKPNFEDQLNVYKVVDGEIIDDVVTTVTNNSWTDGTNFYDSSMQTTTEPEGEFTSSTELGQVSSYNSEFYKKIDTSWFKVAAFSTTMIVTDLGAVTDTDIITALEAATPVTISYVLYTKQVLTQNNSCGTAVWDETQLTVTLVKTLSNDSFWIVKTIPSTITDWTLTVASYANDQYKVKSTYDFSTNDQSDIYWKNVEFKDVQFFLNGAIPGSWTAVRSYFTLDNGSNGDPSIIAANVDTSVLENCGCNVLAMNGITSYAVINKIAKKAETLYIHTFADAPAYASYDDLQLWMNKIYHSEYLAIGARPDKIVLDEKGNYLYVYPSANYVTILSDMLKSYNYIYYPPAGFTYGTISAEDLIECDYEKYGNELKTNRINWQRTKTRGSVMWEQRTTYSLDTDLSYIAPTFIVDGLREDLINFEEQFTFRYSTPTDLLNQESGLKSILDNYLTLGFIYSYELNVPTYAEAQKAGRTLTINIGVVITKDAEVININLNLNNA